MRASKPRGEITLIDVLIDGFEKNEVFDGFHQRMLPMPDEDSAIQRFDAFVVEATAWKGPPVHEMRDGDRRLVAWRDLELRQRARGIMVRVRSAWFVNWWHAAETWNDEPMTPIYDWIHEEKANRG